MESVLTTLYAAEVPDRQIHVEIRPVEMTRRGSLHTDQLGNRGVPEPRELVKRQKQFTVPEKQPKTVLRNVSDFYGRSASATLPGFHPRAPAPA